MSALLAFGNAGVGSRVSQKRIALARERVRAAETLVEEQRALVRSLKENGWVNAEAEQTLARSETDLAASLEHLEALLRSTSRP